MQRVTSRAHSLQTGWAVSKHWWWRLQHTRLTAVKGLAGTVNMYVPQLLLAAACILAAATAVQHSAAAAALVETTAHEQQHRSQQPDVLISSAHRMRALAQSASSATAPPSAAGTGLGVVCPSLWADPHTYLALCRRTPHAVRCTLCS